MKNIFATIGFLILSYNYSAACSCFGQYNFCASITSELSVAPDIIVTGVKVEDIYYGMRVEVLEVIQGETNRDTLMVWGDNGALCRVYTNQFSIGDTLILALNNTDFSGNFITVGFPPDLEMEGDYHLSVCGVYYLTVQNGIVNGPIDPDTNQLPYQAFSELACLVLGIPPVPEIIVELLPNPADRQIDLYFWNSQPYPLTFSVFDALGRLVISHSTQLGNLQKTMDVSMLGNGVYFLFIRNEEQFVSRKFVVAR